MKRLLTLGLLALIFALSLSACKKVEVQPRGQANFPMPTGDGPGHPDPTIAKDSLVEDNSVATTYESIKNFAYCGLVKANNNDVYAFEFSDPDHSDGYHAYKVTPTGRTPVELLFHGEKTDVTAVCDDNAGTIYYAIHKKDSLRIYIGKLSPNGTNSIVASYQSHSLGGVVISLAYDNGAIWWLGWDTSVSNPTGTGEEKLYFHNLSDQTKTANVYSQLYGLYYTKLCHYGPLAMIGKGISQYDQQQTIVDKNQQLISTNIGSAAQIISSGDSTFYRFNRDTYGRELDQITVGSHLTNLGQISQDIGPFTVIPSSAGNIVLLGKQRPTDMTPSITEPTGKVTKGSMVLITKDGLKTVSTTNFYTGEAELLTVEDRDGIWFANLSIDGTESNMHYFRWVAKK